MDQQRPSWQLPQHSPDEVASFVVALTGTFADRLNSSSSITGTIPGTLSGSCVCGAFSTDLTDIHLRCGILGSRPRSEYVRHWRRWRTRLRREFPLVCLSPSSSNQVCDFVGPRNKPRVDRGQRSRSYQPHRPQHCGPAEHQPRESPVDIDWLITSLTSILYFYQGLTYINGTLATTAVIASATGTVGGASGSTPASSAAEKLVAPVSGLLALVIALAL